MLTKRQLCMARIRSYLQLDPDINLDKLNVEDYVEDLFGSSSFAIAMEYIYDFEHNYPSLYEYTSTRGGKLVTDTYIEMKDGKINNIAMLSFRELLELLPE